MTSPDTGAEPPSTPEGTVPRARGARIAAPVASEAAASQPAPPPRPRRGAPPLRSTAAPEPVPVSTKVFDSDQTAGVPVPPADDLEDAEPVFDTERPSRANRVRSRPAKRPERRFRQTVQKVDLWSVTKMALCFYISAMAVVVVALIALWMVAESAGVIDNVESFLGDLFSSEDFHFVSAEVLRGAALVAIVLVALMVVFTVIAASFYNIFAELFGGIEIVIREEEQPPKR